MDCEVRHDPSEIAQLHLLPRQSIVIKRKFRFKNSLFSLKNSENRRALGTLPSDPLPPAAGDFAPRPSIVLDFRIFHQKALGPAFHQFNLEVCLSSTLREDQCPCVVRASN